MWSHYPPLHGRVRPGARAALAIRLPRMLEANAPGWEFDDASLPADGIPAHGHLPARDSRSVVHAAFADLVIPGFAHVGVDPRPAEAWLARRRAAA